MPINSNGIYTYEESDSASPFSTMLNRLANSVTNKVVGLQSSISAVQASIAAKDQYSFAQNWYLLAATPWQNGIVAGEYQPGGWNVGANPSNRIGFNTSNGEVTIPSNGLYMIAITASFVPTGANGRVRLRTGGNFERYAPQLHVAQANAEVKTVLNTTLPLNAGIKFYPLLACLGSTHNRQCELEVRRIG